MIPSAQSPQSGLCWLASYPKSGNTWFRIVLWACVADDPSALVDLNAIQTGAIASSRSWIDDVVGFDTADMTQDEVMRLRSTVYRWSASHKATGYHKIHDALWRNADGVPLIDDQATRAVVYILRNPLDVAPSLANHIGKDIDAAIAFMGDPKASLSRSEKKLSQQLLQHLGTWSAHVTGWVEAQDINVLTIRYEDMLATPHTTFAMALAHLGLQISSDRLAQALEATHFDKLAAQEAETGFRERPAQSARFFRRGQAGGWRDTLTAQQITQILADHGAVMTRFGYLDTAGQPV